jgi:hypothetical protein
MDSPYGGRVNLKGDTEDPPNKYDTFGKKSDNFSMEKPKTIIHGYSSNKSVLCFSMDIVSPQD